VRTAERREHELGLARELEEALMRRFGEGDRAHDAVLRQGERPRLRRPLLVDEDLAALEVDVAPAQGVEFAGAHPLVDRRVQERGERGRRQLIGECDEVRDRGLTGRRNVTAAAALLR